MANNTLKYRRIDPQLREQKREAWNQPVVWPLGADNADADRIVIPAVIGYRRHEKQTRPALER